MRRRLTHALSRVPRLRRAIGLVIDQYRSLEQLRDRNVALLGVTNFLDAMSGTLIIPLLPVYADRLGADAFLVGVIFAAPWIASSLLGVPFGTLADRTGRRRWIVGGLALGGASVLGLALVGAPLALVALRALDGVARAMKSGATNAYVGDLAPADERGRTMSAYQTLGRLGVAVGPAVGGLLAAVGGIRLPFLVLGGATALGSLCLLSLPRIHEPSDGADPWWANARSLRDRLDAFTRPALAALLASVLVSAVGTGAFSPLFALLMEVTVGGGPGYTGLVWSSFGLGMVLFIPVGGTVADEFGRKWTLVASKLTWVVVLVGLVGAATPAVPLALLFVAGIASAFGGPALGALQYELAPDGREGLVAGLTGSLDSAGRGLGPVVGGAVASLVGVRLTVVAIALLWALGGLGLAVALPTRE